MGRKNRLSQDWELFEKKCENIAPAQILLDSGAVQEAVEDVKLDAGRTIRSGFAYDFDSTESVCPDDAERAAGIKEMVGDEPLKGPDGRYGYLFVKRVFDFCFSASVLIVLSWLFLLLAIIVKVDDPKGPVFSISNVLEKTEKFFYMYKFRSMCVDAEARLAELRELNEKTGPVFKIADDPRITKPGKWLRKLSLDELPQFFNVLKGDIPLRILKTRPEFSEKSMGAFALPAKSSTNKEKAFSQVVSCFASDLRMRRISGFNCNCISGMETQFLAKPVFGAVCA